ncbi:hypothetical protein ABW19_dt0208509 [Dactylella cylindrospora]|nr:hypothetical protein ABW19_dt0208509 [Dactylella cylindrospora]
MVRLSTSACATALLTLALHLAATNAMFSVHEDLLAYPQYEVRFPDSPDSYITEEEADRKIASMSLKLRQGIPTSSATPAPTDTPPTEELQAVQERSSDFYKDSGLGDQVKEIVYEPMIMNNKRYLCSIPVVEPPPKLNATERRKNKDDEEKELARATVSGTELLKGMEGTCLYFISGWWSYSFCYNDHIKQFHQLPPANGVPTIPPKEDPSSASYILGRAAVPDRDAKPEIGKDGEAAMELQANGEAKYLSQKLAGGTLCDITGKERKIELQYHCAPNALQDRIGFIKEVTTCCYLMTVYTPRLCSDPAFQPLPASRANTIECLEVMNEERIKEYKAEKEKRERNLQDLLEIVGREIDGEKQKMGSGKKTWKAKPKYRQPLKNKAGKQDETFVVVDGDGNDQIMMIQEMDLEQAAALFGLQDGVDLEQLAAAARGVLGQAGGGDGGQQAQAGQAGAGAGAEGHDEL